MIMVNVKVSSYMNYEHRQNYGTHSLMVEIGDCRIYFSYQTVIVFYDGNKMYVSENIWGNTTGKHLREIEPDKRVWILRDEFEQLLNSFIDKRFSSQQARSVFSTEKMEIPLTSERFTLRTEK